MVLSSVLPTGSGMSARSAPTSGACRAVDGRSLRQRRAAGIGRVPQLGMGRVADFRAASPEPATLHVNGLGGMTKTGIRLRPFAWLLRMSTCSAPG